MRNIKIYSNAEMDEVIIQNNKEIVKLINQGFSISENGKLAFRHFTDNEVEENTELPTVYYGSSENVCLLCGANWDEHDFSAGTLVSGRKCNC